MVSSIIIAQNSTSCGKISSKPKPRPRVVEAKAKATKFCLRGVLEVDRGQSSRTPSLVEATTDDCCHAVEMLVMRDQPIGVLQIARELGITHGSVLNISHDRLCLKSANMGYTFTDARLEVNSGGNVFRTVSCLQCQLRQLFVLHCN